MTTTIVLAEDDPDLGDLLEMSLSRQGYDVHLVDDGANVVSTCREVAPAMLLLDLTLPHRTGADICAELRADASLDGLPVVLMTGHSGGALLDDALAAGADDLLRKPFRPADLVAKIEEVLAKAT